MFSAPGLSVPRYPGSWVGGWPVLWTAAACRCWTKQCERAREGVTLLSWGHTQDQQRQGRVLSGGNWAGAGPSEGDPCAMGAGPWI